MSSSAVVDQPAMLRLPIRNTLARAVYNKMAEDRERRGADHSHWYAVDLSRLDPSLADKFVQFHDDVDTRAFLDGCQKKSDWVFTQLYHVLAKAVLGIFMTNTSINGFLRRGSMFVFSRPQFSRLLGVVDDWRGTALIDLGAGDGMVTAQMAPHFSEVYVTEASKPMRWRLEEKGYKVLEIGDWSDGTRQYDVVSCLNLLDRCDRPLDVLTDVKRALRPGTGRAVVAVVLPFRPYVEFGSDPDHRPTQALHPPGRTFEARVAGFVAAVFSPLGLVVEAWTRLPYLCEGDLEHSFYVLDDVVFSLSVPETT